MLTLYESIEVGGKRLMFPFQQRLLWLRESHCKIIIRHRAAEVVKVCELNDFYGFLASLRYAVTDEIPTKWNELCLDAKAELCVEADIRITETPVIPDETKEGVAHNAKWDRKQYLAIPSWHNGQKYWYTSDRYPNNDEYASPPRLEAKTVIEKPSIYSTLGVFPEDIGRAPPDLMLWVNEQREQAGLPQKMWE
jgi:hypothetical protein